MPYYRPIPVPGPYDAPALKALPKLAGGWLRFDRVEVLDRGAEPGILSWREIPAEVLDRLTAPRGPIAGLTMNRPRVMAILNITPDSFSDGGQYLDLNASLARGRELAEAGADILDIGGESTRPGAPLVPEIEEASRILPVILALRDLPLPISVDTRKAGVAQAALGAGATLVNDVAAMGFDPHMASVAAATGAPICLMHSRGTPDTMQDYVQYEDVLLDVYDHLDQSIAAAEAAGVSRSAIIADPGIGFAKTGEHNLAILRRLSLFHGLGVPILVGVSRKRFIGVIGNAPDPADRAPGSIAVALAAVQHGIQILRVHDTSETVQAFALWKAVT